MRRSTLVVVLLVFTAVATSCSSVRGQRIETGFGSESDNVTSIVQQSTAPMPREASPSSEPIRLGQADASDSFDFTARELYSGGFINGNELFGQGSILVTFVQPGCELAVDDGPTIAAAAEQSPEVTYVIIHSGADDDAYISFAAEAELYQENMVHLSDHLGILATRYGITEYPTTLLIAADMSMSSITGVIDSDGLQEAIMTITASDV